MRQILVPAHLYAMSPDEAAAFWALRTATGLLDHEQALFDEWLRRQTTNAEAWARAHRAWHSLDQAENDDLLAAMRAHALSTTPRPRTWVRSLAAVATAVFAIVGGSFLLLSRHLGGEPVSAVWTETYRTDLGGPRRIVMPDNTAVMLDAGTTLSATVSAGQRAVRLTRGQAFFQVRHDPSRPFTVQAGDRLLTDVGTNFNVAVDGNKLEVFLADGALRVAKVGTAGDEVTLRPGQQLSVIGGVRRVTTVSADDVVSWQSGLVEFRDELLSDAVATLNRYGRDKLVVRSAKVAKLRVSGTFKLGDVRRFGRTLVRMYPITMVDLGNGQIELQPTAVRGSR